MKYQVLNIKNLLVFFLIFLALALGGCDLVAKKTEQKAGEAGPAAEEAREVPKGEESYTFKALKAAIELGIPLKCSYKVGEVEYTGYIKGRNWRGKMDSGDGRITEVIMKDNCMYSWMEGEQTGMKMCFEEDMWESEGYQQPTQTQEIDYFCTPAVVGNSQFEPPANVNFMDTSQQMQQMQEMQQKMEQ